MKKGIGFRRIITELVIALISMIFIGGLKLKAQTCPTCIFELVADISPGGGVSGSSNLEVFREFNGELFFRAFRPDVGYELFKYNPTSDVVSLVADINVGIEDSTPKNFTEFKGELFFSATTLATGEELYKYNPISGVVSLVYDIEPGTGGSKPGSNLPYYTGTFTILDDDFYFLASTTNEGLELFRYNSNDNSVIQITNIAPGSEGSDPQNYTIFNGDLYFSATSSSTGYEVYRYIRSNGNIQLVTNINSGTASTFPSFLTPFNGELYFRATTPSTGFELFKYNPILNATNLVEEIEVGPAHSDPQFLIPFNGELFFSANSSIYGRELFKYNINTGISLTADIEPGTGSSIAYTNLNTTEGFIDLGDELVFKAFNSNTNTELYRYHPVNGVSLIGEVLSGPGSSNIGRFETANNRLFFQNSLAPGVWFYNPSTQAMCNIDENIWAVASYKFFNNQIYAAGTYDFTILQELYRSNCTFSSNPSIDLGMTVVTNVSCYDFCDGSIDLSVSGGEPPYSYLWTTGSSLGNQSNLCREQYCVTVTDFNGETDDACFEIMEPSDPLDIALGNITDELGNNNNGAIDISPLGGTPNYSYNWSNGEKSEDISGLTAGVYTITVTDANGCITVATYTVSNINPIVCKNTVMDFDGINDNIFMPGVNVSSDFTIGCWFETTATSGTSNAESRIFGFASGNRLEIGEENGNLWIFDGTTGLEGNYDVINDGIYHHVAFVAQGNTRNLYLDFELVHSYISTSYYGSVLRLGTWGANTINPYFLEGQIDDFKLILGATAVSDLCSVFSSTIIDSTTVIYYDFEDGIGESNNSSLTTALNQGFLGNGILENFNLVGTNSNYICGPDTLRNCVSCNNMDTIPPTAQCDPSMNLVLPTGGRAFLDAVDFDNGSIDNCDDTLSFSVFPDMFSCQNLGLNTITLTVTDDFSNSSTCTSEVTVLPPSIELNITSVLTGCREFQFNIEGELFFSYSWTSGAGETSNLPNPIFTYPFNEQFDVCVEVDSVGCIYTECIIQTVDVECDNCSVSFVHEEDCYDVSFTATTMGYTGNPTYEWLVNDVFQSESPFFSFDKGPGTYEVCLTVSDMVCSDTYCETIRVDSIFTTITNCPTNPIVLNVQGNCEFLDYSPPLGFENPCLINSISSYSIQYVRSDGLGIFDALPLGSTNVQGVFTGDYGEVSSCGFVVEVVDTISPVCIVTDLTIQASQADGAIVNFDFMAIDNCPNPMITYSSPSGQFYACGVYSITAIVADASGNSSSCDFQLEVMGCDNCNTSFEYSQECYELTFNSMNFEFIDNPLYEWEVDGVFISESEIFSFDEGPGTYEVCLTVSDNVCSDTYCETIVVDEIFTEIPNCPTSVITLNTNDNCSAIYDPALSFINACLNNTNSEYSFNYVRSDGLNIEDSYLLGTTNIQATFVGDYGEVSTCEFAVEVVDNLPPNCNELDDVTLQLDSLGNAVIDEMLLILQVQDNCGSVSLSLSKNIFTCSDVGEGEISVTATDQFGNSDTCSLNINVLDEIQPECSVSDLTVQATQGDGAMVNFDFPSIDNCSNTSISYSPSSGIFYECGQHEITANVIDGSGNNIDCSFILNVTDCEGCCISESAFNSVVSEGFHVEPISQNTFNCVVQLFPNALDDCHFITQITWGDNTITNGHFPVDLEFTHEYIDIGNVEICITVVEESDNGDCFQARVCQPFTITSDCAITTSISGLQNKNQVKVFPNPSNHSIHIESDISFDSYDIFDVYGNLIRKGLPFNKELNISQLLSGAYLLRLNTKNESVTKRIIKID